LVAAGGKPEVVPWRSDRPVFAFDVESDDEEAQAEAETVEAPVKDPEVAATTTRFRKVPMLPIGAKAKPPAGFRLSAARQG
jgi:hypothetical protein